MITVGGGESHLHSNPSYLPLPRCALWISFPFLRSLMQVDILQTVSGSFLSSVLPLHLGTLIPSPKTWQSATRDRFPNPGDPDFSIMAVLCSRESVALYVFLSSLLTSPPSFLPPCTRLSGQTGSLRLSLSL